MPGDHLPALFRTLWFYILVMGPLIIQAQVKDDFSDGNFTENPVWKGDLQQFEVSPDKQLHLSSSGSDTSALFTSSARLQDTEWNFWVRISFNTSLNNYCRVYLAADSSDLTLANSLFLQIGGSHDSIMLVERNVAGIRILYRYKSYLTSHSSNFLRFRIIHEPVDHWKMLIDTTGETNYLEDGSCIYHSQIVSRWFGIFCRYTSSNAGKMWLDDLYAGPVIHDTLVPSVNSVGVFPDSTMKVYFSEPVDGTVALNPGNYRQHKLVSPQAAVFENGNRSVVVLRWMQPMADGESDSLMITGITDLSGNRMNDTVVPVFYYQAKPYDVVIHEILADPEPSAELPAEEFIELYNRSGFPVNLKGWSFVFGSFYKVFPGVTLSPRGYLILSKTEVYKKYGDHTALFTSAVSLANEGTTLTLKNEKKAVIHTVTYDISWFRNSYKEEGGWSLEMTDPENPCGCVENWEASMDPSGGTPGRKNSIARENRDEREPHLLHAYIIDSMTVATIFSESMDSVSLKPPNRYRLSAGDRRIHPSKVTAVSPDFQKTHIVFDTSLVRETIYQLTIRDSVTDCAGNHADTTISVQVGYPDSVQSGEMIINELLSDPEGDGSRFFEIYNRSDKIIDLHTLVAGTENGDSSFSASAVPLTQETRLAFPGDYFALARDPADIENRYRVIYPDRILRMDKFPSLGNDSGKIILARRNDFLIVDQFSYYKKMHFPLLLTTEGVSLERASPEVSSADPGNWHSTAESAGFATPGYQNSQYMKLVGGESRVTIEPEIFSPDNDGKDDLTAIMIREQEPAFTVSIAIFSLFGLKVRQITENHYSGNEGRFLWNGLNDQGRKCNMGIYLVFVEMIYPDGRVIKEKKRVVLTAGF